MEGDNIQEIRRLSEELTQVSHKLAEAMYQQASQAGAKQADTQAGDESTGRAKSAAPEEDVVDADFEEVKDGKK
jgi:molecular chaperone DnaK